MQDNNQGNNNPERAIVLRGPRTIIPHTAPFNFFAHMLPQSGQAFFQTTPIPMNTLLNALGTGIAVEAVRQYRRLGAREE
jgi:hypothetical protein